MRVSATYPVLVCTCACALVIVQYVGTTLYDGAHVVLVVVQ